MKKLLAPVLLGTLLATALPHTIDAGWVPTNGPYGGVFTSVGVCGSLIFGGTIDAGIYRSTDNGDSWVNIDKSLRGVTFFKSSGTSIFTQIGTLYFLSLDAGASWNNVDISDSRLKGRSLEIIGDTVVIDGTFLSTDNGITWIESGWNIGNFVDIFTASNGFFYAGTNLGFFISTDNGASWTAIASDNKSTSLFHSLTAMGNSLFVVIEGKGVCVSSDSGASWKPVLDASGITSLAVCGSVLLAGADSRGVFRSTDKGATWSAATSGLTHTRVTSLAVKGDTVFAAMYGGGIFRSTDTGINWTAASFGIGTCPRTCPQALVVCGNTLITGDWGNGVFISNDNGATWLATDSGLSDVIFSSLFVSGNTAFIGADGKILRSADSGRSWKDVGHTVEKFPIETFAECGGSLFAGGYGVYRSTDNGMSWAEVDLGINSHSLVRSIAINGNSIFAATSSYGIYRSTDNGRSWLQVLSRSGTDPVYVRAIGGTLFTGSSLGNFYSTDNGASWNNYEFPLPGVFKNIGVIVIDGVLSISFDNGASWIPLYSEGLPENPYGNYVQLGDTLFATVCGRGIWKIPLSEMMEIRSIQKRREVRHPAPFAIGIQQRSGTVVALEFTIPQAGPVSISAFTLAGKEKASLVKNHYTAGTHTCYWNTRSLARGCYTLRLQAGAASGITLVQVH